MTLQQAISNLKIHQQWRLGADIVMIEPKELTESIDIVLSQLPQQEISDEEIEKAVMDSMDYVYLNPNDSLIFHQGWMRAIKWYREQLKQL
jgi:hypothetical protein